MSLQSVAADVADGDAEDLALTLHEYVRDLDDAGLEQFFAESAANLLLEIDRSLAGEGDPPGTRVDPDVIPPEPAIVHAGKAPKKVGLISLPWMAPALPSIQLATLASVLEREGMESDVHELYVDYAARVGLNLYNYMSNMLGYFPEWVFSRHYYGPERGDDLSAMLEADPLAETRWMNVADVLPKALEPVTRQFLDDLMDAVDWSRYDVLGCSLTISQLGASMAFARRIKQRYPEMKIVFGGSQCAGAMGKAILKICPYVDAVVHVEGELVFPELVQRLRSGASLAGLPGTSFRDEAGELQTGPIAGLYRPEKERLPLSYDSYFRRLMRLGLMNKMSPWLPFEGSRGCWYGQKVQCTFCGLHEIMEFRAWEAEPVLAELERMYERYQTGRFYMMDLILPREYTKTLLPEIARRGHDWMFFWEVKANMKREELEILANAGVRWVQPGIESLDQDLLKLMKKGVSPLQNILLLKWCQELSIFSGWNLIFGLPGETQEPYKRMAALIPKLHHLKPPSGGGSFQLHRFSPYFDHPEEYGIRWTGAHPMYRFAFAEPKEILDELVYLHEYERVDGSKAANTAAVEIALLEWRRAYRKGAALTLTVHPSGASHIADTRELDTPKSYDLDAGETALYLFLDAGAKTSAIDASFREAHPMHAQALDSRGGTAAVLEEWERNDLVLSIDGRTLSLATRPPQPRAEIRPPEELNAGPWIPKAPGQPVLHAE
ncbi:MAG TPA: RiPP maturation radical SAM C-methyltransferase [Thermoanaerobaculia bacterium]